MGGNGRSNCIGGDEYTGCTCIGGGRGGCSVGSNLLGGFIGGSQNG